MQCSSRELGMQRPLPKNPSTQDSSDKRAGKVAGKFADVIYCKKRNIGCCRPNEMRQAIDKTKSIVQVMCLITVTVTMSYIAIKIATKGGIVGQVILVSFVYLSISFKVMLDQQK